MLNELCGDILIHIADTCSKEVCYRLSETCKAFLVVFGPFRKRMKVLHRERGKKARCMERTLFVIRNAQVP